jgi:hypothetical protein
MNPRKPPTNVVASVHQRLLNLAQQGEGDFQTLLTRYGLERLMYRLTRLDTEQRFILKGALAFCLWEGKLHRATRDLDFLGSGDSSAAYFAEFFRAVCRLEVEEDGIRLDEQSLEVRQMREDEDYRGVRVQLVARLGTARIPLIVDFGFGDVVTPPPAEVEFPALLGFPKPRLLAYHRETVIAEKFWIMSQLGINNTRLKDYFDLWTLAQRFSFEGEALCQAIRATFARRDTAIPAATPVALTAAFSDSPLKQSQWASFLKRGRLVKEPVGLADVIPMLYDFLMPPAQALVAEQPFSQSWPAGGPWQNQDAPSLPASQ